MGCAGSSGPARRMLPHDLPPWYTVYQQRQRWLKAGVFAAIVHDLRALLRLAQGCTAEPSAAIFDSRMRQAMPESGTRAGYDGAKRRRGSQGHRAVDTLGHLLALHVTAADAQDRSQVTTLATKVQAVTGDAVEVALVEQGYTGAQAAQDAQAQHMRLEVVKLPEAKKALSCCHGGGSWSGVTPGRRAFAAWRGMMNSWQRRSRACIL
jgi:transposase